MASYSDRYYKNLYRQQNTPNISLGSAGLTAATFTPLVYTPDNFDVSTLQRSLATLDERKEKTDQQRSAIRLALGQIKLNEAEDEWKNNYTNEIINKIDNAARFGDYSAALEVATDMATKAVSDPQLTARVRANEQYQAWKDDINKKADSNQIDAVTRDRLLATNKYKFVPVVDSSGSVVGGKNWMEVGGINGDAVKQPVNKTPITQSLILADKLYKERISGGNSITFKNAAGETVDYYDSSATGSYNSGSQRQYKDEKVLKRIFDEVYAQDPNVGAYIEQMYNDAVWELKNKDIEYKARLDNGENPNNLQALKGRIDQLRNLVTDNGINISLPSYLKKLTDQSIKGLAYNNVVTNVSASSSGSSTRGKEPGNDEPINEPHINQAGNGGATDGVRVPQKVDNTASECYNYLESVAAWRKKK